MRGRAGAVDGDIDGARWRGMAFGYGLRSITGPRSGRNPRVPPRARPHVELALGREVCRSLVWATVAAVPSPEECRLARVSMRPELRHRSTPGRIRVLGLEAARWQTGGPAASSGAECTLSRW